MTTRLLDFLRCDDLPVLSRANFARETQHLALWGVLVGAVDGTIAGIVAKKTFGASDVLTTAVWALPIIANILNLIWGVALRSAPRMPAYFMLALGLIGTAASVALTPQSWREWGAWLFAAQVALAHLFLSGILTVRSTLWRVNYPQSHRARITGRLLMLRWLVALLAGIAISLLFDRDPLAYRYVYPAAAAVGAVSLLPLRRLRVRGERAELRQARAERYGRREGLRQAAPGEAAAAGRRVAVVAGPMQAVWQGVAEAGMILRQDRAFAQYMVGQFLLGSANFFTDGILLPILAGTLGLSYFMASLFIAHIPNVVMLVTMRAWSGYLDRLGVVRFRVSNTQIWILSYVFVFLAMLMFESGAVQPVVVGAAFALLACGRVLCGAARGGGTIAWSIGHLDFARPDQAELYMGIHVALTGVRGLLMPMAGALASQMLGSVSFAIAIAFASLALWVFHRMAGQAPPRNREAPAGP